MTIPSPEPATSAPDAVPLDQPQELGPAAVGGAVHPERAPFLQRLQQAVQRRGVPLRQQLPGDERAAGRTEQPRR